jgi:hypothetical protein
VLIAQKLPFGQSWLELQACNCEQNWEHPQNALLLALVKQKQLVLELLAQFTYVPHTPPPPGQALLLARAMPGMPAATAMPATPAVMRRIAVRRPIFSSATVLDRSSNQFAIIISFLTQDQNASRLMFRLWRKSTQQYKWDNDQLVASIHRNR